MLALRLRVLFFLEVERLLSLRESAPGVGPAAVSLSVLLLLLN